METVKRRLPEPRFNPAVQSAAGGSDRALLGRLNRRLSAAGFSRWTISARITAIVLTLAVPLNLVIAAVIWHLSKEAGEQQRTSLLYTARSVAAAVDAKLDQYIALAQALARSPALFDDNLGAFEAEARRTFASVPDAWVLAANPDGQQLMNMALRPGQPLPPGNPVTAAAEKRAFETHSIVATDVLRGPTVEDWIVKIVVPIFKDGQPFRLLAVCVRARLFLRLLNDQQIPKNWLACLIDRQGRFIARVPAYERYVGQRTGEGFRKVQDLEGIFEFLSVEGDPIVAASAHSAVGGWPVAIAVNKAAMQAASWSTIRWAAILGSSLSLLSLLFATAISRRITGPIAKLQQEAGSLLNDPASSMPQGPPEVNDLWQALKQSAADRDRSAQALRESEERLRLSNKAAGIGIFTIDLEAGCIHYSPELAAMAGFPAVRTAKIEDAFARVHRDDLSRARALFEAGLKGASAEQVKTDFRFVRPGGEIRWMTWAGQVHFREEPPGRTPFRIDGACVDITKRMRAEEAVRESEERLRLSNEAGGIGTFTIDLNAGHAAYSAETAAILGYPEARGGMMDVFFERVHHEDVERVRAQYEAALRGKADRFKLDFRFVRPDGVIRWITWAGRVDFREGPSGRNPFRMIGACVDNTERIRAEQAVRASEALFHGVFEHAATGIAIKDLEGRFESCNPAYAGMLGYAQDELRGFTCDDFMHPDDHAINMVEQKRLIAGEISSFESVTRYFKKEGGILWGQRHVSLLQDDAGKPAIIIVLLTDMTQHKHHEEKINLLMREVNHRSKNMLALVQAVARQTLASDPEDFIIRFGARIQALAAAQDLLVKSEWQGVDLSELVRSQLAHFKDLIGTRIGLKGPPVLISASAAQTIGMALHELATNAGKYGALSSPSGQVGVEWSFDGAGTGAESFSMGWREQGGPAVTAPAQSGFGSTVIRYLVERSLDAKVDLDFTAAGLNWRLQCSAKEVLERDRSAPAGERVKPGGSKEQESGIRDGRVVPTQ